LLIAFPSYTKFLFNNSESQLAQEQNKNRKIEFTVSGMTCTSCELHIESEVKKLAGVSFVKASYEKNSATVEFDEQKIEIDKIIAAINGTGYKVQKKNSINNATRKRRNCWAKGMCKNPDKEFRIDSYHPLVSIQ